MRKKRTSEKGDPSDRTAESAQTRKDEVAAEDDAIDAAVKRSIDLHGA